MTQPTQPPRIRTDVRGHVHEISLARPDKRNAFDLRMLRELAEAYTAFEEDEQARVALLRADGEHFTAGLDLAEVGPAVQAGEALFPDGLVDPLGLYGRVRTKPVIAAARGWCLTIGIELLLACDIRLAASDARFGQIEINRGIFPFGGATIRMPALSGWSHAMRWLLTGDLFGADDALRLGLVSEVVEPEGLDAAASELADTVASRAPLGVQATLRSARLARDEGQAAAAAALLGETREIMKSEDAAEGVRSFVERRDAVFTGR